MSTQSTRPWYCNDETVDKYATALRTKKHPKAMIRLKIAQSIIVNVGVISITLVSLVFASVPPAYVGPIVLLSISTLGLYNGVAYADYRALLQAYSEVQAQNEAERSQDGGSE